MLLVLRTGLDGGIAQYNPTILITQAIRSVV